MLMRFDPFGDVDRLSEKVMGAGQAAVLPLDAYREGDHFVVHFDLPGIDPRSAELTVDKKVLNLRAERAAAETEGREWLVAERPRGTFSRQLFLGEALDADRIEAAYDRGVLTVTIPVAEAAKPRKVEIATGGGAPAIETTAASSTAA